MATSAVGSGAWTVQSTDTSLVGRLKDKLHVLSGAVGDPVTPRGGVYGTVSNASYVWQDLLPTASTATGTLQVLINPGGGIIPRAGQVGYEFTNQTQRTVTLTASNATNPRIDRISARIYDPAQGDTPPAPLTSAGGVLFEVTDGTPAGSPVAPALPANSIPIATVLVPANAVNSSSLTVTDVRQSTGIPGANRPLLPGDSFTGTGSTTPLGFMQGELLDAQGLQWRWNGTTWQPVITYAPQAYTPTWTFTGGNSSGTSTGRFWVFGRMAYCQAMHTANGSSSFGTGNVTFSLPFLTLNNASSIWTGEVFMNTGGGTINIIRASAGNNVSAATVWAWNTSNIAKGQLDTPGNAGITYANGGFISAQMWFEF